MVEQAVNNLPVVRLPGSQAEADREPLRVDDDVDLCREPAARATETMICLTTIRTFPDGKLKILGRMSSFGGELPRCTG